MILYSRKNKFTIILLENSNQIKSEQEAVSRIVNYSVLGGKFIIINYGSYITLSKVKYDREYDDKMLFVEKVGDEACLYDTFDIVNRIVKAYSINSRTSIEIVGIGRGIDNCSKTSKKKAMKKFKEILKHAKISTKYYCINDSYFLKAAAIGFRVVGSIKKDF